MKNIIITALAYLLIIASGYGQQAVDFLKQAQQAENHSLADSIINIGLKEFPMDHDLLAYDARLNAWQQKYDNTDSLLNILLEAYPNSEEALNLKLDLLYWQNKTNELIDYANTVIREHGYSLKANTYIIKSLINKKEYNQAKKWYNKTYALFGNNAELALLKGQIQQHNSNSVSVSASALVTEYFDPAHITTLGYGKKSKHSWSTGLSYGEIYDKSFYALQAEAYPRLSKKSYLFVDGYYSMGGITNNYVGLEFYHTIKMFEVSGGYKVFNTAYSEGVIKSSISAYFGRFYASYRNYLKIGNELVTSQSAIIKLHFDNPLQYVQVNYTKGGDQIFPAVNGGRPSYHSSANINYQHVFKGQVAANLGFGLTTQTHSDNQIMLGKEIQVGIKKVF